MFRRSALRSNAVRCLRSSQQHARLLSSTWVRQARRWLPTDASGALRNVCRGAALAFLTAHFIVSPPRGCGGPSMLPTLQEEGDRLVVSYLHGSLGWIARGDIVSFVHPMHPGQRMVKRVIGLPGDLVARDTPPHVGERFYEAYGAERVEYEDDPDYMHGQGNLVRVPEGHCWVTGDNLSWSRDSRHFGPLPLSLVVGVVVMRWRAWFGFRVFWPGEFYRDEPDG